MTRIPYPDAETLGPEKRAILSGSARVLNNSRMSMHASDALWLAWRNFARTVAFDIKLDPALRELIILRVGHLSNSDYEVQHHLPVALKAGASQADCDAMGTGDFTALTVEQRAAANFTTEIVRDANPGDAVLAEMQRHFSHEDIFSIILMIGGYMTTARIVATGGVTHEAGHE